jgi:tRNA(Ile)-lysidine synthase
LSFQAFDRRLDRASPAPLAVAFSGGGDSMALLLAAKAWADGIGRRVLALHVDHGLQAASGDWARQAERMSARIGVECRVLAWTGEKPTVGLPAAARAARHGLIAEAARAAGARVILVGHTLDDQFENALMRQDGQPIGSLREWSPSPVWPQGRGLFHLRPLLASRRDDLRAWLRARGIGWIDDPANDDARHPRARARARLRGGEPAPSPDPSTDGALRELALSARTPAWGGVGLPRAALAAAPPGAALRLLQIAAACVSGRESLGRPGRARAVLSRLRAGEGFIATLGGARMVADDFFWVVREAGEFSRSPCAIVSLTAGQSQIWDGRFEVQTDRDGLVLHPLIGHASRLNPTEKTSLWAIPEAARGALPTITRLMEPPTCPILAKTAPEAAGVRLTGLVADRFLAACGIFTQEDATGSFAKMADCAQSSYVGSEC